VPHIKTHELLWRDASFSYYLVVPRGVSIGFSCPQLLPPVLWLPYKDSVPRRIWAERSISCEPSWLEIMAGATLVERLKFSI
jgi:hypothetical protein